MYAEAGIRRRGNAVFRLVPGSIGIFADAVQTELAGNLSNPFYNS